MPQGHRHQNPRRRTVPGALRQKIGRNLTRLGRGFLGFDLIRVGIFELNELAICVHHKSREQWPLQCVAEILPAAAHSFEALPLPPTERQADRC